MTKAQDVFEKILVCLGFPVVLAIWCLVTPVSWTIQIVSKIFKRNEKQ